MRPRTLHRQHGGFTTVELLIIIAIIGFIALIVLEETSKAYRKWQLDSVANEMTSFLAAVPARCLDLHSPLFLIFQNAGGRTNFRLALCRNAAGTNVVASYDIPNFIAFHGTLVDGLDCNWPVETSTTRPTLRCDTNGITTNVTTGTMVNGPQTLVVTHRDMTTGDLKPRIINTLRVSPLWRGDRVTTREP